MDKIKEFSFGFFGGFMLITIILGLVYLSFCFIGWQLIELPATLIRAALLAALVFGAFIGMQMAS